NIRQLVNTLTFAEAVCETGEITVHHLPDECTQHRSRSAIIPLSSVRQVIHTNPEQSAVINGHCQLESAAVQQNDLLALLRHHRWNISAVAKQLGVSRPTVYRRMKKLEICLPKDV
ncbi:helix-turn-helix domain-containing protein, partial [Neptunomonas phycophila]